MNWITFDMNKF